MKVIVQQEILAKLLAKGGLAALTDGTKDKRNGKFVKISSD